MVGCRHLARVLIAQEYLSTRRIEDELGGDQGGLQEAAPRGGGLWKGDAGEIVGICLPEPLLLLLEGLFLEDGRKSASFNHFLRDLLRRPGREKWPWKPVFLIQRSFHGDPAVGRALQDDGMFV